MFASEIAGTKHNELASNSLIKSVPCTLTPFHACELSVNGSLFERVSGRYNPTLLKCSGSATFPAIAIQHRRDAPLV